MFLGRYLGRYVHRIITKDMLKNIGNSPLRKISTMTNKEDGDTTKDRNPRMAALLAVHLVSQVLEEAYDIATTAKDSGQSWHYLSLVKSWGRATEDHLSLEALKGDCDKNEYKVQTIANVATSTPQKVPNIVCSDEGERGISRNETKLNGQGDEDLETQHNEHATSSFINRLFDMSDVEREIIPNQSSSMNQVSTNPFASKAMQPIAETCIDYRGINLDNMVLPDIILLNANLPEDYKESLGTEGSEYSFLSQALPADINRDVAFYIDDDTPYIQKDKTYMNDDKKYHSLVAEQKKVDSMQSEEKDTNDMIQKNVALYENAYATLNRDYDLGSEDEFPILQDPKGLIMQEVELMTANTSKDDIIEAYPETTQKSERESFSMKDKDTTIIATPTTPTTSTYKRNTLAKKCRIRGARLLSCFRGMWRRGLEPEEIGSRGKAKSTRSLSPVPRRRAISLLEHCNPRSPTPKHWKYKTINEVMLHTSQFDYSRVGANANIQH